MLSSARQLLLRRPDVGRILSSYFPRMVRHELILSTPHHSAWEGGSSWPF